MPRRVLVAKKRGRVAGALLGGILAGPLGALAGAILNSKTDYYEDEPKAPQPVLSPTGESPFTKRWFWLAVVIFLIPVALLVAWSYALRWGY